MPPHSKRGFALGQIAFHKVFGIDRTNPTWCLNLEGIFERSRFRSDRAFIYVISPYPTFCEEGRFRQKNDFLKVPLYRL
uniref:Uncharacterized protein n=1 Tax=Picea glauca TaxID=3330 RepID=A0A101M2P5_PICGL|nr:hypothetical protein ABT39_MTgene3086 [Picea glauca]QHR87183.1 hypothetical protein Q903MT_gene1192 [Picea sitchensis]